MKVGLAAAGLLVAAGLLGYFMIFYNQKTKVCFNDVCFQAEAAKNRFTIARGLMFRENLAENEAMLFAFKKEGFHSFWLKNILIPLDIIFLDKNKKVIEVVKNVQPCKSEKCQSYRNQSPAQYVLEVNAGTADRIGLQSGSLLRF